MLGLSNCHAITRNNHYFLGLCQQVCDLRCLQSYYFTLIDIGTSRGSTCGRTKSTGNYCQKLSIHSSTHDVTQDGTTTTHQSARNNQKVIIKHEPCRGSRPA